MSMAAFTPIFPFLSVLGGVALGIVAGLGFVVVLASIRYRDFPRQLVERAIAAIIMIGCSVFFSFALFRWLGGTPDFNIAASAWHIIVELVLLRANFFLLGGAVGLLATLAVFLIGMSKGTSQKPKVIHSPMRSVMSSWQ
jgi:hypothetical protein